MRCKSAADHIGQQSTGIDAARLAEEAGWDGLFVWDHLIGYNQDLVGESGPTSWARNAVTAEVITWNTHNSWTMTAA